MVVQIQDREHLAKVIVVGLASLSPGVIFPGLLLDWVFLKRLAAVSNLIRQMKTWVLTPFNALIEEVAWRLPLMGSTRAERQSNKSDDEGGIGKVVGSEGLCLVVE